MRLGLKCCLGLGLFIASATISCGSSSGIDLYAGGQAGRDAGASGRAGSSALGSGGNAAGSGGTGGGASGFGGAGAAGGNGAFGAGGSSGSGFGGSGGSLGASGASGVGGSLVIDAAAGSGGTSTSDSGINVAGSVVCGSGRCSLPSEFCCRYVNGQAPACVATGATCLEGTDLFCDGPEDCDTGQVCCGRLVQSNFGRVYNRVSCTAPSDCAGTNDRIVCGSDSTECQNGRVCAPSDVAPELRICREP